MVLVIVRKGIAGIFVGSPTVPGNGAHLGFSSTRKIREMDGERMSASEDVLQLPSADAKPPNGYCNGKAPHDSFSLIIIVASKK